MAQSGYQGDLGNDVEDRETSGRAEQGEQDNLRAADKD